MQYNAMYELFSGDFYDALRKVRFYAFQIVDIGDRPVDLVNVMELRNIIVNLCNNAEVLPSFRDKALEDLKEVEKQCISTE